MGQPAVQAEENKLSIGDTVHTLDREIRDYIVEDETIIVAYEFKHPEDNNLVAFNCEGSQIWDNPDKDAHETAFQSLTRTDSGEIHGITWEKSYEIDPETGELDAVSVVR